MTAGFRPALLALLCVIALTQPARAEVREVPGIPIPIDDYALIEDWNLPLRLSGATVVQRSFLPLFAIALYVDKGEVDGAALANGMEPCRLALHWLTPELSAPDALAYWNSRFDAAIADPEQRERLRPMLERIAHAFGDAHRGDVTVLDYHPDRGLRIVRNGVPAGQFAGLELNRAVLGMWLGPKTPSEIRDSLLARD